MQDLIYKPISYNNVFCIAEKLRTRKFKICWILSVLFHPKTILQGFRATIHIGNIRQTAIIEGIEPISRIKTNDAALVSFKFIRNPEYVTLGSRVLFRDGRTKGIGNVTKVEKYGFCNTIGATMSDIDRNKS